MENANKFVKVVIAWFREDFVWQLTKTARTKPIKQLFLSSHDSRPTTKAVKTVYF